MTQFGRNRGFGEKAIGVNEVMEGQKNLRIHTLGSFELYVDDQRVQNDCWPLSKALELFKFLIAHRGHWIPREVLLDRFWPEMDPQKARNNLHVTIHALKRMLEPERAAGKDSSYLLVRKGSYQFSAQDVWLDVDQFESLCAKALQEISISKAIAFYEQALALYRGDFLQENVYDDWPVLEREKYREKYFHGIEKLCGLLESLQDHDRVIFWCRQALGRDPLLEDFHRRMIRNLVATGKFREGVEQYQFCLRILREKLSISPEPETERLYLELLEKLQRERPATYRISGTAEAGLSISSSPKSINGASFEMRDSEVLADNDTLMHLESYRHLLRRLEEETAKMKRFGSAFSLVLLEVDCHHHATSQENEKKWEETRLRIMATIRQLCRPYDVVFQWSNRFVVLLPMTGDEGAVTVANRLAGILSRRQTNCPHSPSCSLSLGYATCPTDGVSPTQILETLESLRKKSLPSHIS